MKDFEIKEINETKVLTKYIGNKTEITIPDSVTSIRDCAFEGYSTYGMVWYSLGSQFTSTDCPDYLIKGGDAKYVFFGMTWHRMQGCHDILESCLDTGIALKNNNKGEV